MSGRLPERLLQVCFRAFGLSQAQFRDRENVQRVHIVRQRGQNAQHALLRILEHLLVAAGGHQFRQFQLRPGVLGVQVGGFPKIRGRGVDVVCRQVRQAKLVVGLGVPRLSRRGILEMQNCHRVVLLLELFLAFFQILGFLDLRRLGTGG